MSSLEPMQYQDKIIRAIYRRHLDEACDPYGSYDAFKNGLIEFLDEVSVFYVHILSKFESHMQSFIDNLSTEDWKQMAGLHNLLGMQSYEGFLNIASDEIPDIKLTLEEGEIVFDAFEEGSTHLLAFLDDQFLEFFKNVSLKDFQNLSEEEQGVCLSLLNEIDIDFTDEEFSLAHKKLVFALHIPQGLKDYHEACAKELCLRILTSPVYAMFMEGFFNRGAEADENSFYYKEDADKKFVVSAFMKELADIWQMPEPLEGDLELPPEEDKQGKKFTTFMQASYVAPSSNEDKIGLIFKINSHDGYLPEGDQNIQTLRVLAHEFGHLISDFLMVAETHTPWHEDEQTVIILQKTPLLSMDDEIEVLSFNNQYRTLGRYYGGVTTDFGDLPKPFGKHVYKGQLEERHADYVADLVEEMILFALECRSVIRDFEETRDVFWDKAEIFLDEVVYYSHDEPKPIDNKQKMDYLDAIASTKNFDELETLISSIILEAQSFKPYMEDEFSDFEKFSNVFFEMRTMVEEQDYKYSTSQEISLHGA